MDIGFFQQLCEINSKASNGLLHTAIFSVDAPSTISVVCSSPELRSHADKLKLWSRPEIFEAIQGLETSSQSSPSVPLQIDLIGEHASFSLSPLPPQTSPKEPSNSANCSKLFLGILSILPTTPKLQLSSSSTLQLPPEVESWICAIPHSLPFLTGIIDENSVFVWVNEFLTQTFGIPQLEWMGNNPRQLVEKFPGALHPEDMARGFLLIEAFVKSDKENSFGFEHRILCPTRSDPPSAAYRWFRKVVVRLNTPRNNGKKLWLLIAQDIQEQKDLRAKTECARDAADNANRLKSQFLNHISHETRTPCNGIMAMLSLLSETKLDKEQLDYLNSAISSSEMLLSILNEILDYGRLEAGKLQLNKRRMSVRELVEVTLVMLLGNAEKKQIDLLCAVDIDVPDEIICDPLRLRQILINLINNAIKFTKHGFVYVRVCRSLPSHLAEHLTPACAGSCHWNTIEASGFVSSRPISMEAAAIFKKKRDSMGQAAISTGNMLWKELHQRRVAHQHHPSTGSRRSSISSPSTTSATPPPLAADQELDSNVSTHSTSSSSEDENEQNKSLDEEAIIKEQLHDGLCFEVTDTGIGLPESEFKRIFKPYVQVGESSRDGIGTGLGLGICKKLVHALNGEIGVESKPGEGSQFWFQIPLDDAIDYEEDAKRREVNSKRFKGLKVLLLSKNDVRTFSLKCRLQWYGADLCELPDLTSFADAIRAASLDEELKQSQAGGNFMEKQEEQLEQALEDQLASCVVSEAEAMKVLQEASVVLIDSEAGSHDLLPILRKLSSMAESEKLQQKKHAVLMSWKSHSQATPASFSSSSADVPLSTDTFISEFFKFASTCVIPIPIWPEKLYDVLDRIEQNIRSGTELQEICSAASEKEKELNVPLGLTEETGYESESETEFQDLSEAIAVAIPAISAVPINVLVAEDEPINARVMERFLSRLGYSFEVAQDGLEADDFWKTRGIFQVCLMDTNMPRMSGIEAIKRIRETEREFGLKPMPIISVTGAAQESDKEECIAAGADAVLTKPFKMGTLDEVLQSVLKKCDTQ